jgi:large subunit ribosomal protein L10
MSLSLNQKKAVVSEVTDAIASANASVLAEYRGLTVTQLSELRRSARDNDVFIRVVKNTLAKRVVKGSEFECLTEHFIGPVIFSSSEDPVAVAKVMSKFAKQHEKFNITAGAMNGEPMDEAMIAQLAKLPSRDELLGMLVGTMNAPIQKLVQTMNEVPARFARTLAAVAEAKDAA